MSIVALFLLLALIALCGLLLGYFAQKFKIEGDPIVEKIEAVLPQTQCGQCGFAGCKPYAQAIAKGEADINRCPPGGQEGVQKLADLLGLEAKPLDAEVGEEKPPQVAFIVEDWCIGCTKCIKACPVDAIIGSNQKNAHHHCRRMHRLRTLRSPLPCGLHRDETARCDFVAMDTAARQQHGSRP